MQAAWWVPAGVLLAACITDCTQRRIPNGLFVVGVVCAVFMGQGFTVGAWGSALWALCVMTLLVVPLWRVGAFGGGDAKLLMAIGPFLGVERTGWLLAATLVSGGILALGVMSFRQIRQRPHLMRGRKLPYSWAIATAFAWEAWRQTTAAST